MSPAISTARRLHNPDPMRPSAIRVIAPASANTEEGKAFTLLGLSGGAIISVFLLVSAWGHWHRMAFVVGVLLVFGLLNVALASSVLPRLGEERTEWIRSGLNLVASLSNAWMLDWPLASWLYLPFICALVSGHEPRQARLRLSLSIVIWDVAAGASGVSFETIAVFSFAGLFCHEVAAFRVGMIEKMNVKLRSLEAHAIGQEKLAGLGMLAAGVAHEINNPMAYVTSNLCTLLDDLNDASNLTPALIEHRDQIVLDSLDGVRRVNATVSDLRRFASGERDENVCFDLRDEVEAAVRIVRHQLKPNQSMIVELPTSLSMVGIPRQLGQVFLNLLVNSVHALPAGGSVITRSHLLGDHFTITVDDTGAGMDKATLSKLFQPFFTTKGIGKGLGLGLSVVHGIVLAHGGRIDVSSTEGLGSSFQITLPLSGRPQTALPF